MQLAVLVVVVLLPPDRFPEKWQIPETAQGRVDVGYLRFWDFSLVEGGESGGLGGFGFCASSRAGGPVGDQSGNLKPES